MKEGILGDIKKFFNKTKNYHWVLIYVALIIIIFIGAGIRAQPLDNLVDATTGEYISLELDSSYFYRYAQDIAENGKLEGKDTLSSAPLGRELGFYGMYTSYFVASAWQFLSIFSSDISVEYVDVIYPLIAMAIMSLFFFLLLRRIFDWKVGLLGALLINVLPSFLFRSMGGSSDHDILGMMLIIMSFYFYFVGWESKKLRNNIIFGAVAGILTFLASATGGAGRFVLLVVAAVTLVSILFHNFKPKDFWVLVSWLVVFSILIIISGEAGIIKSLSVAPAYFALLAGLIYYVIFDKNYLNLKKKLKIKLPQGVSCILIALILGIIVAVIAFGFEILIHNLNTLSNYLFNAFQYTRVGLTVAENRKPFVTQWFSQFGTFFVLFFIIAAIILFYKAIKPVKKYAKKLTWIFGIFIFLYIFSRYSPKSILNGENAFSKFIFIGSIVLFVGYMLYVYLNSYYKDSSAYKEMANIDHRYLFLLIWFLITVILATSAIRFLFEFSIVAVILVSFFLMFMFDYFYNNKEKFVKYAGIIVILLILFSPFGFAKGMVVESYEQSSNQAKYGNPGYNAQWQQAGKWVRENTPEDSVFVHWWDYGYWVQTGFERATVTDGGHQYKRWDHLVARDVLTAQTLDKPLKFLKSHEVDYLLIISDEIGKYPAFSSIASNPDGDRLSYLQPVFGLDRESTRETRNGTVLFYAGGMALDEDFVYDGRVYPARRTGIAAVILPLKKVFENGEVVVGAGEVEQPIAVLVYGGEQIRLPMRCVYADKMYEFEDYEYGGCFKLLPIIQNNQMNDIGGGLIVSPKVVDSLFARLYLFDEENPYYELVYDDSPRIPLAVYGNMMKGPLRIWKVNYPGNLTLTREDINHNLAKKFTEEEARLFNTPL